MSEETEALTRAQLVEQAAAIGIVLSDRASRDDLATAIDAYARGFSAGCEKSYQTGYDDGQTHAESPEWAPQTWDEAVSMYGRTEARLKHPVLFDEHCRRERIARKMNEMHR